MSEASTLRADLAGSELFGLAAEFNTPEEILAAANRARETGYKKIEAYTPYAVEGLDEALGHQPTRLGWVVLFMGTLGALGGFFMQWFSNVQYYPLNIGGKPLNSWPNFIVITFECAVLVSAFTAGLFMLARNGLPKPYHSIFNTPNFEHASRDKFFLCIETADQNFDLERTKQFLEDQMPNQVSEVEL
ncbi:MAG: DUF3341 domain-containing protein [Trueperaceae bacterium]|nr:MAG: DUF3341 domain-containing protein [Trueperaceae bacterium]